ncbi:MAG: hypothetical protein KGH71_01690 [Candidatus Micrarchaeota archaeon]|nr:hypothetical protein [Candidatus Micrarchaeota archaeon]
MRREFPRKNLDFKEPELTPQIKKIVGLVLKGKTNKTISEELGIKETAVVNALSHARRPDEYRKKLLELRGIRPSAKALQPILSELDRAGFIEVPKDRVESQRFYRNARYLIINFAQDGLHPYFSEFDNFKRSGQQRIFSAADIFGEAIQKRFFVLDEDKFEQFRNEVFSEELVKLFLAKNGDDVQRRRTFTSILHDNGMHSRFCKHDWRKMRVSAADFKHEGRKE